MRATFTRVLGRRRTPILLLLAVLVASTTAWAYWAAKSNGSASGQIGSLSAPQISSATPGGGTVALSWTAVSAPAGGTVSYYVRRDGGAASSACPSSGAPGTQTSCTDTGVSTGSHKYTVTAVWHSWTAKSESASAQVTSGAATQLVLTPATTTPAAGAADNLTITAKDAANNTVTSYAGAKALTFGGATATGSFHPTVTSSAGTATDFATPTTVSFTNGVATVSGASNGAMTLYKAETAKITVTDGTVSNGGGVSVTVSPGSASGFSLSTPATQTAGTAFSETITAIDAYGNTATSYTGPKTLVFSGPSSSPGGEAPKYPASVTFSSGIGSASITLFDADEGTTLTATQGSISGSSGAFTVNALTSVANFALSSPGSQTAGNGFVQTITARDTYGNTATSYAGPKTLVFSGPSSSPGGKAPAYPSPVSFSAGVGTPSITLYDAQTTTLTATQGTIKGTSASFTVAAAAASSFTVPTPSTQTAGTAFNVTLTAKDAYGNTASGYEGAKAIGFSEPDESPGGEAPKYPSSVSFSAGSASASITLYDAQTTTLRATDGSITGATANFTVNAKSTTKLFGVSVPAGIVAGKEFNATLTAEDEYGNLTIGYTGSHSISFSGPAKSPNNKSPVYDSSISFSSGKASASTTLYDAQTTMLKASASSGAIEGESESFTVASASPSSLSVSTPAAQTAGVAFSLSITAAKDAYGNLVGGTQTLSFTGPSSAPDGTAPSYPPSATFTAGEAKATVTLSDAQTSSIKVTSGTANGTTSNFTVNAAPMTGFSLTAVSSTVFAGQGDELTIKAVDAFENTITSYTGSKSLKFSGAKANGAKQPTVSNASSTPVSFEEPTTITFASGVAKSSGSSGVMKLYAIETAHVAVSEGAFTSNPLGVTVEAAEVSSLTTTNHAGGTKGRIEKDDTLTINFNDQIAANSFCSSWTGNGVNHELSGSEVTVTLNDGSGASDDTLAVSAIKCTIHLGTIDLGSGAYVSGGSVTFNGSGSNASTVKYTASSEKLTIELGSQSAGTTKTVSSSAATLTPDANLTDEFGSVFPTFTTATIAQF
jgi:hypothetical protein